MKDLIGQLHDASRYSSIDGSWAKKAADALDRLTAGDVELPTATTFCLGSNIIPGEWCRAGEVEDYGDRRAASAVLAERERCALICDDVSLVADDDVNGISADCARAIRKGTQGDVK